MRSDMTIPIARLVANRFADAEPPLRLCYLAHGLPRRAPAARPDARVHAGRRRADRDPGARRHRRGRSRSWPRRSTRPGSARAVIGLGDADLYRQLLGELAVAGDAQRATPRHASPRTTSSGSRPRWRRSISRPADRETLIAPAVAARRPRGARPRRVGSAARSPSARRSGLPRPTRRSPRAASPIACSSTSACCATSATTPGRSSRSTTRRSATCSAAAAATTS